MRKSRILEILRKSPKFENPPHDTMDLVPLSFVRKVKDKEIYPLVSEKKDVISRIVKSPFFNVNPRTTNFKEIVESMSAKDLRNILFTLWLLEFESAGKYDSLDYDIQQQNWLLSGVFAFTMSKFLGIGTPADRLIAGMLQDVSKLALSRTVPEVYSKLEKVPINARRFEETEEKEAGVSHADISADLVYSWGFPDEIVEPIRLHHQIEDNPTMESQDKTSAQIVGLSGRLAELVLQLKGASKYADLENRFAQYFGRQTMEFPNFLRMALENAKSYASPFGLRKLPNFSGLRVLKENPEFLKRRLIPYEEMLEELVVVYEQVEQLETALERSKEERTEFHLRDALTGLCNHAYFQETLNQEVSKSRRYEHPISMVIFDIDNFRLFNQAYGYSTGNSILQEVSQILVKNLRESDTIARYGDDSFAILIPQAARVRATVVAEKLRKRIEEHSFANPHKDIFHKLTVSVGFSTVDPSETAFDKHSFLQQTLKAVEMAQHAGGNRCRSTDVAHSYSVSAG